MKNFMVIVLMVVALAASAQKPGFTITGNIEGLTDGKVYLKQRGASEMLVLDSAKSTGGKFILKGSVEIPDQYYLTMDGSKGVAIFVENKNIEVSGKLSELNKAFVTGSKTQDEMNSLKESWAGVTKQSNDFYQIYKKARDEKQTTLQSQMEKKLDSLSTVQEEITKKFIKDHPNSFVSPTVLQQIHYGMEGEELKSWLDKFSPEVMKSKIAQTLAERVVKLKTVAVGNMIPDFTQNDSIDHPVKLSDVYSAHKYTLVDFWASWCGPCRQENPNVVAVWKDYNAKGFHVMGVSFDKDKAKWLKAVASDHLTWTQVSDLKYWNNEAAKLYAINSIPANLLLDNKGKIIARNITGEKLREKIAELLK